MRNELTIKANIIRPILVAAFVLALALTFFCSSGKDDDQVDDGMLSYGGQKYKIVEIGRQTWMAENLNYPVEGSKCYEGKDANCDKYGRLYSWAMANTVCPPNWSLPSNEDWDNLYRSVDGTSGTESPYSGPTAGKFLKAKEGWNDCGPSGSGKTHLCEDTKGFAALPGGYRNSDGNFLNAGSYGSWWSSSENGSQHAYYRDIYYLNEYAYWHNGNKSDLLSVRCVKK